ncbi:protein of unknown function [Rhodovastum atsumiense]|nr:protein of unknown function [Rhodovastum atsumiense]
MANPVFRGFRLLLRACKPLLHLPEINDLTHAAILTGRDGRMQGGTGMQAIPRMCPEGFRARRD